MFYRHILIILFFAVTILTPSTFVKASSIDVRYGYFIGGEERFSFHIDILGMALEVSGAKYKLIKTGHNGLKQDDAVNLIVKDRELDILWTANDSLREKELKIVPIPLDSGLLGYRVFVIRNGDQNSFVNAYRLNTLKKLRPIQGYQWVDTAILRDAGFDVVTGDYYRLPELLIEKTGDFIPRSVRELETDLKIWSQYKNQLAVEENIALSYRQAEFFYVHKDNSALYEALKAGLEIIHDNGALKSYIDDYLDIKNNDFFDRKTIFIRNPYESRFMKNIDNKYFYFPAHE